MSSDPDPLHGEPELVLAALDGITSLIGRLEYLSARLDAAASPQGNPEVDRLLRDAHERTFAVWLGLTLKEQRADWESQFSLARKDDERWLSAESYRGFVPPFASQPERRLFLCDLEANLAVLRNSRQRAAEPGNWRVCAALALIEERSGDVQLSLKLLSQRYRISPGHFGAIFRKCTGKRFHSHLRAVRVACAAALLRDNAHSIRQVAFGLGYSDVSNFVREFRTVIGVPPGWFRNRFAL